MPQIFGIHHITAIASHPQQCVDFYTKVLGLRLVKKTVNQDQVEAYHLFFGDRLGEPGMDLTFFTFPGIGPGHAGMGMVTQVSLAVPEHSLEFWEDRLDQHQVTHRGLAQKWDRSILEFQDPDGLQLQLVGYSAEEIDQVTQQLWTTDQITEKEAIRAFHSAQLTVPNAQHTELVLTKLLGYELDQQEEHTALFIQPEMSRAKYLELYEDTGMSLPISGAGTVHHIAFGVKDETVLAEMRQKISAAGLYPTQIIDRFWFKSVYFRIPAGILFELATMGPGFAVDEDENHLGETLVLPPFLEDQREEIEAMLEPINV